MTDRTLHFNVHSGGSVDIDVGQCDDCETKACINICDEQDGPLILDESQGIPMLRWSRDETERGGCVECLGCELSCGLVGREAIRITLPIESFEEYLGTLTEAVVYQWEW